MVSSNFVYIGYRTEGNFSFAWGNWGSFFSSLLAGGSLACSCLLQGCSGELLVLDDQRSNVFSREDDGRENFNTREKVYNSSKGYFKAR